MCLVTSVITTYKRAPDIVIRALRSVVNQTYSNMECIVVDDSPSDYKLRDDVMHAVLAYSHMGVQYVRHTHTQGACAARNTGLKLAKGEYVGFLDDDDEWLPNKIERQIEGFTNENIALVYCDREVVHEDNRTYHTMLTQYKGNVYKELLFDNFIGSTSFPLIRTKALLSIGGFDILMQASQDYDVWLRLSQFYEINYVPDILVKYHVHSGERITTNFTKKINGFERLNSKNSELIQMNRKIRWMRIIELAPMYSGEGHLFKGIQTWVKAIGAYPFYLWRNCKYLYRVFKYRFIH